MKCLSGRDGTRLSGNGFPVVTGSVFWLYESGVESVCVFLVF